MSTVLISGASRGLGLEFARQYLEDGWHVIALCRNPDSAAQLRGLQRSSDFLTVIDCDVADFAAVEAVACRLDGRPIDVLLNNAGIFGPKRKANGDFRQSFGQIDYDIWSDVLRVNTLAVVKLCEALVDNVASSKQKKIVTLSSRIGSIGETHTGLYAYRSSKAAVNMAMATLAHELAPRRIIVASFSPGWVKTDMGGADALLDADDSVARLRALIAELTIHRSGAFLDYDGSTIPW